MKRLLQFTFVSSIVVSLFLSAPVYGADPTPQKALKDWNNLITTFNNLNEQLKGTILIYKSGIVGTKYDEILPLLASVEKELPAINKKLDAFEKKYGASQSAIDSKIRSLTDSVKDQRPSTDAGRAYEESRSYIKNIPLSRKEKAEELIKDAELIQNTINSYDGQVTQENYDTIRSLLDYAIKFDPENATAKEMRKATDKDQKEKLGAIQDKIASAKWPKPYTDFAGPGKPDDLAEAAMNYLHKDEARRPSEDPDYTFAVIVKGEWRGTKKNFVGETIQWGLPVWAACSNSKEKEKGLCRVFSLTMVTREERYIKKEPPFTGAYTGDSYKMLSKNIDAGGSTHSTTGGFFGFWFRILLSAATIVAGLLAAAPLLKVKVPHLAKMYDALTPLRNMLGVIILAVGAVSLVRALLFCGFALFADLLPQLAAIVVGLFLGKEMIFKKPAETGEEASKAEKVQEKIAAYEAKIALLEKYQVPLGIACLVLGVLHLLLGGLPLV
jgi:hypothetical protein